MFFGEVVSGLESKEEKESNIQRREESSGFGSRQRDDLKTAHGFVVFKVLFPFWDYKSSLNQGAGFGKTNGAAFFWPLFLPFCQ
ncbi:hypothetical protein AtEden1_Chr3g0166431 [Arabidopsis thaliana]